MQIFSYVRMGEFAETERMASRWQGRGQGARQLVFHGDSSRSGTLEVMETDGCAVAVQTCVRALYHVKIVKMVQSYAMCISPQLKNEFIYRLLNEDTLSKRRLHD